MDNNNDDELNTFQMSNNLSGTLGRGASSKLPNKSFNTYATHSAGSNGKGGNNVLSSGLNLSRLSANAAGINASNRLSGSAGESVRVSTSNGKPRNSFAFTMRTNLDQEL